MQKTAEAVSLGHPDKTSDYISSYILDRLIEQDAAVKYAVEVMIKDNTVVLGGEVSGQVSLTGLKQYVLAALAEIGYDERYAAIWQNCAIDPGKMEIINLIGQQSTEIGRGVEQDGWGDQGIFIGYACRGEGLINRELRLARRLNNALYEQAKNSDNLGLDIKTQITLNDGRIETAIAAVPMRRQVDLTDFIVETLGERPRQIIVNGTGCYTCHSAIADCGITGRKLACDFYSGACPIGGGSPWTKDASKADLTLNLYARKLATEYLADNDECFVYLSSCIGRAELPSGTVKTILNGKTDCRPLHIDKKPSAIIAELGLDKPVFAKLCRQGISGFAF